MKVDAILMLWILLWSSTYYYLKTLCHSLETLFESREILDSYLIASFCFTLYGVSFNGVDPMSRATRIAKVKGNES